MPIIAYSPFDHDGAVLRHPVVEVIARRHAATPAQVALAWVLRLDGVCALPKAADLRHTRENRAALGLRLTLEDFAELDHAFPPPSGLRPLEML
ncbi:aldo/keto reductase [Dactylosporangium sp. NPDC051484]|uniref:aldo/keto reductase n=1 Tax=Dactylosporangium sp. NPDC051484 TaxID=3154942 RepID=UPI00344EC7EC